MIEKKLDNYFLQAFLTKNLQNKRGFSRGSVVKYSCKSGIFEDVTKSQAYVLKVLIEFAESELSSIQIIGNQRRSANSN